jgi:hypothetical protein
MTLRTLRDFLKIDPAGARSKSWEEFKDVCFDFVITVCDQARESCPYWPGQPIVAHWGVPDPVHFDGTEAEQLALFREVARVLARRLELFVSLPIEKLDRLRLAQLTQEIGALTSPTLLSQPSAHPSGERRENDEDFSASVPLLPGGGGAMGEGDRR